MKQQPNFERLSNKELTLLLIGSIGALVMAGVTATELDLKIKERI